VHHYIITVCLILSLAGCREAARPGSQPLPEPVTAPASTPAGAATGKPGSGTAAGNVTPPDVIWDHLGQWSGRQSVQTESFTGLTGGFRIKWQTKGPADGKFLLTIHSSISGRPLTVAVDQVGPGADVAYVNEDPRVFFAVIESSNIEWSFSIEEAMGTRTAK
jgi:hypothetical protein